MFFRDLDTDLVIWIPMSRSNQNTWTDSKNSKCKVYLRIWTWSPGGAYSRSHSTRYPRAHNTSQRQAV